MTRGAAVAVLLAALVAAVLTSTNDPAARASSLDDVVAHVRTGFGDNLIAHARIDGSTLDVVVATPPSDAGQVKSAFEAHVLAAAVADGMRSSGQNPITAVRYANLRGAVLSGSNPPLDGEPVSSTSGISSLGSDKCRSVAEASVQPPLTPASVEELPYLHGACVFRFRTSDQFAGSHEAQTVLAHLIRGIGDPDHRPWFFELDGSDGKPLDAASWMPGVNGSTWARPGLTYAMAHG